MDKINCILLTVFIIVTVSCNCGDALRCYNCEQSPFLCRMNVTCHEDEDACLQIRFVHLRTYSCWRTSRCTTREETLKLRSHLYLVEERLANLGWTWLRSSRSRWPSCFHDGPLDRSSVTAYVCCGSIPQKPPRPCWERVTPV